MSIKFGDCVKSNRHGHTGRVYKLSKLTNDQGWINGLSIPYTNADIQDTQVHILCDGGGSVCVPMNSCEHIPPIENFTHPCNDDYFPPAANKFKRTTFYIMKAHHLTSSGRKLGLKKITRDEPNCTVLVTKRNDKPAFIIGSAAPSDYGVAPGQIHEYVIDTGNGYKGTGDLNIIDVLQIEDGVITKGRRDHANAYTWVMK